MLLTVPLDATRSSTVAACTGTLSTSSAKRTVPEQLWRCDATRSCALAVELTIDCVELWLRFPLSSRPTSFATTISKLTHSSGGNWSADPGGGGALALCCNRRVELASLPVGVEGGADGGASGGSNACAGGGNA